MDKSLDEEKLAQLAKLARIELSVGSEDKLLRDAEEILAYFGELNRMDTDNIEPMTEGTDIENAVREDVRSNELLRDGVEGFPVSRGGFLEVPGIMKEAESDL
jgi:aspartyl/glutamyl-tRNA(Asn/Gln) amidotransferase C subunit